MKKLLSVLLIATVLFSLAGCNDSSEQSNAPASPHLLLPHPMTQLPRLHRTPIPNSQRKSLSQKAAIPSSPIFHGPATRNN